MLERHVCEVEVDALHEQVGGDEHVVLLATEVEHGAVVAHALEGLCVLELNIFCEASDESEFA